MKKMLEPAPMRVGVAAHTLGLHPITYRPTLDQAGQDTRLPSRERSPHSCGRNCAFKRRSPQVRSGALRARLGS